LDYYSMDVLISCLKFEYTYEKYLETRFSRSRCPTGGLFTSMLHSSYSLTGGPKNSLEYDCRE